MSARVRYRVDISDVDDELARLQHGLAPSDLLKLEVGLTRLFLQTQEVVHVITGSLKNSGNALTRHAGGQWYGEISYGGASPGAVNNPVNYAGFEQARGLQHDFMRPLYGVDVYGDTLLDFLDGRL